LAESIYTHIVIQSGYNEIIVLYQIKNYVYFVFIIMILNRLIVLLFISLFSHLSFGLDTQVYIWVDEKGERHYAEEPPEHVADFESRILSKEDVNTAYAIPNKTLEKPLITHTPPKPPIVLNPEITPQLRVVPRKKVIPADIKPPPRTLVISTTNNPYVSDLGKLLLPEDNHSIQNQLAQFRAETGIHLSLITVFNLQDYAEKPIQIAEFSQTLLEKKAYGQRSVLLLIALLDKKAWLAFSADYSPNEIKQIRAVMKKMLFPHFRDNNFNQGVVQGLPHLLESLTQFSLKQADIQPVEVVEKIAEKPIKTIEPAPQQTTDFTGYFIIILLLVIVILRPRRHHPHQCPQCHAKTESCLDLPNTATGLAPAPTTHGYSVWRCPQCATHVYWAEQFK
jgi:uncharacterized membrane protein YgcG